MDSNTMKLYKALCDNDLSVQPYLQFKVNDIIEFLYESSESYYYGKNIMTGSCGLFPNNFVNIISIPDKLESVYVLIKDTGKLQKGDILVEIKIEENFLLCWLLDDELKYTNKVELSNLLKLDLIIKSDGFIQCVATSNHQASCATELSFSIGNVIWMERKLNDEFAEGILQGNKGSFPLNKIYIKKVDNENIGRKNIWAVLYNFDGSDSKDLAVKKGEKLRFLDRINNDWNLMQKENGKVGMVPCSYLKNISINAPLLEKKPSTSDMEIIQNEQILRHPDYINDLKNVQIDRESNEYEFQISEEQLDKSLLSETCCYSNSNNLIDIDKNILEENQSIYDSLEAFPPPDDAHIPDFVLDQFKIRQKRVENEIEIILDDIKSIQNKCSKEGSSPEEVQQMSCNLSFLKEEYKAKLKELEFVKDQKQKLLGNESPSPDYMQFDNIVEKQSFKRSKIIEEVLTTELKFINDLKATLEAFDISFSNISDQDFNLLFGDLKSVISAAEEFYAKLSKNTESEISNMEIGTVFLECVVLFEDVYKEYCINYDRKIDLISKKSKNLQFMNFINTGLRRLLSKEISIITLDMMLVKPLQRILKYPLLLKSILENTLPEHQDFINLKNAYDSFTLLATKINEKKHFEELRALTFDRPGKWHKKTLHAIQKKPIRAIVSLSGGIHKVDSEYEIAVTKFKMLKKRISSFKEIIFILRDNFKEMLNIYSSITESLASILKLQSQFQSKTNCYLVICKRNESEFSKTYITALNSLVINPINELIKLFSGPLLLIKKRNSMHIDYFAMKQRMEDKTPRVQIDKMEQLKNKYSAINNTLKDDLPLLTSKATVIFNGCVANYLHLSSVNMETNIQNLKSMIGEGQTSTEDEQRICRNQQHDILLRLQRELGPDPIKRNSIFKPDLISILKSGGLPNNIGRNNIYHQTKEDILGLRQRFREENLAIVKKDFIPTKSTQIHISSGTIVGILKRLDPQGLSTSWLVEVCPKRRGFLPRSYLTLITNGIKRGNSVCQGNDTPEKYVNNRYSVSSETFYLKQFSQCGSPNNWERSSPVATNSIFQLSEQIIRVALYDYQSRGESEISMQKNDSLELIESHDNCGSRQWSKVKNLRTGALGYVPTNYLSN